MSLPPLIDQPVSQSVNQASNQSINQSMNQSTNHNSFNAICFYYNRTAAKDINKQKQIAAHNGTKRHVGLGLIYLYL